MTFLLDVLDLITTSMIGARDLSQHSTFARQIDISPFVSSVEERARPFGLTRVGEDTFRLGSASLVYGVEPLLTPEGRGLADVAVDQLEWNGVEVHRVTQPHEHVLAIEGSKNGGWLEARILAARGWIFLIDAPSEAEGSEMATILDDAITEIEVR
jgi:hypothetical protein